MVEHFPILEDFCFGLLSPLKTPSITKFDLQQHCTDHLSTALKRVETAPGLLAEAKTIPTIERVGELVRLPVEREKSSKIARGETSSSRSERLRPVNSPISCCHFQQRNTNSGSPGRVGLMSDRHQQLDQMPLQLKLPAFATGISSLALKASRKGLSHEAFLYELARLECEQRLQNRIERLLVQSRRQREKTLDKFKLEKLDAALRLQVERLSSGKFVKEAINVITFIFNPAFQASRSKSLTHYRCVIIML